MKCKKRYNHLLKLIHDLQKRFKKEYLCELREQQLYNYRGYCDDEKLVLNHMVVTKDDDITPRNKWKKKGGTDELIKVSDRKVRSATLCVFNKDG